MAKVSGQIQLRSLSCDRDPLGALMSDLNLSNVNLVLIDHRVQLRNTLRMALNEAGLQ